MGITLSDIPRLTGPRHPDAEPARGRTPGIAMPSWDRRHILRTAFTAGTAMGLTVLGVFPTARTAHAADGYKIRSGCTRDSRNDNCEPGCGPSKLCFDCCRYTSVGSCTASGWFKNDRRRYRLRPNQCFGGGHDGWVWKYDRTCGCCRGGVKYRCHDGSKKISGRWRPRICRSTLACNCRC